MMIIPIILKGFNQDIPGGWPWDFFHHQQYEASPKMEVELQGPWKMRELLFSSISMVIFHVP